MSGVNTLSPTHPTHSFHGQVVRLRDILERDAVSRTGTLWRDHAKSTCEVVSTLTELLSSEYADVNDLRDEIVYILGCLGSVDFHCLLHGDLPYHHRDPYRVNQITIDGIKRELLMQTYKLLWDVSVTVVSSAKRVLQSLRCTGSLLLPHSELRRPYIDIAALYSAEILDRHDLDQVICSLCSSSRQPLPDRRTPAVPGKQSHTPEKPHHRYGDMGY